eukprot:COSAG01_NODE_351_length_18449_cov_34.646886_10_plen_557_part_00
MQSAREWATQEFAAKLGLPLLYQDDGAPDDGHPRQDPSGISAGGGQMMSCRDHARFGQLMVNRGSWPIVPASATSSSGAEVSTTATEGGGGSGGAGGVEQLITPELVAEVTKQQIPKVSKSYGLLTWLGGAREDPDHTECCAPRWGGNATCSGKRLRRTIIGDDVTATPTATKQNTPTTLTIDDASPTPAQPSSSALDAVDGDGDFFPALPANVGVGMGWLGQYMFVVPDENLVVVSLGESWGSSLQCAADKGDGYDDAFSVTQVWRAFRNYTIVNRRSWPDSPPSSAESPPSPPSAAITPDDYAELRRPLPTAPPPPSLWQRGHLPSDHRHRTAARANLTAASSGGGGGGFCTCACPPGRGYGACFEMAASNPPKDCSAVGSTAASHPAAVCPALGVPKQCHSPPLPADTDCAAVGAHMHGDVGNPLVWGGTLNCSLRSPCQALPHGSSDPRFTSAACTCKRGGGGSSDDATTTTHARAACAAHPRIIVRAICAWPGCLRDRLVDVLQARPRFGANTPAHGRRLRARAYFQPVPACLQCHVSEPRPLNWCRCRGA